MTTLCVLESDIPPEAPPLDTTALPFEGDEDSFRRFCEYADSEVAWDADRAVQGRLADSEAIQLEIGSITQQKPAVESKPHASISQTELWRKQTVHKNSLAAKLREAGLTAQASKLELCHSYYTVAVCSDCGSVKKFPNRCNLFFCPECQAHLARERRRQVEWWTGLIRQPKHVILTVRNIPTLTGGHIQQVRKWFNGLRRRKAMRTWGGGFYSIEITNEGKGWHVHIHALVDAKWIDSAELALAWDSVTGGMGRIVKVKDCRGAEYLQEVVKYNVKGPQLAAWSASTAAEFVTALDGIRTFGVFGALYGARTEFAEFIATLKSAKPRCDCGSCRATYYSEADWILKELRASEQSAPRPPPAPEPQLQLVPAGNVWPD